MNNLAAVCRHLQRQLGGFRAFEDAVDIISGATVLVVGP
jgi:hypothetical protein